MEMKSEEPSLGNVMDLPSSASTPLQKQLPTPASKTFGWIYLESSYIPFIIVDDRYVSIRILNDKVFSRVKKFSFEVYNLFYVKCSPMKKVEADMFNMINIAHEETFGSKFLEGSDYKMRLFEFLGIYYFLKFCEYILYDLKTHMYRTFPRNTCGFLQMTANCHVPFVVRNKECYVPLFCVEGDYSFLEDKIIVCTKWEMSYFKLLVRLQNNPIEFNKYDLCLMVKTDDLLPFVDQAIDTKLTWLLTDMSWMKPKK
ncbi:hypothetical protein GWI33_009372 [Rhynchophorus ferrugineus]|uniref:Uncharacterized protein n=1 Tax=Rhynchophorus ferrugineus TaxID=354439 RepID=A0A834MJ84_RHYFE|nr:hypothetical protein GWI33_009372 [Rhynchophorus ferrugineus]